jgi:hypothetical protein
LAPAQAAEHKVQRVIFKFHHTIASHPQRNLRARCWHRAVNTLSAAAHLHPDEEHSHHNS